MRLERNKAVEEAREMRSDNGRMEKERDRVRWGVKIMEHRLIEHVCRIENKMLRMEMEDIRLREDRQECI